MRKFIAFMIVALPLTAILSTAAGFWYAGQLRLTRIERQVVQAAPVEVAPVVRVEPTVEPVYRFSLLKIQLSFCLDALKESSMAQRERDLEGVHICAKNLREIDAPADYNVPALADQFEAYATEYQQSLRDIDADKLKVASARIKPIGEMMRMILDKLPAD